MANEIRVLDGDGVALSGGALRYTLLMLFPIGTPKTITPPGGSVSNVVYTPSARLPVLAAQSMTTAEKAQLDAGTLGFRLSEFVKDPALTNPQLVAAIQAMYTQALAEATRDYNARYQHVGTFISAP